MGERAISALFARTQIIRAAGNDPSQQVLKFRHCSAPLELLSLGAQFTEPERMAVGLLNTCTTLGDWSSRLANRAWFVLGHHEQLDGRPTINDFPGSIRAQSSLDDPP